MPAAPPVPPPAGGSETPARLVHLLTGIHAAGCAALVVLAVVAALGGGPRLARTPGSRIMVDVMGPWLPVAFLLMAAYFGAMAWGSWRGRAWSWPMAVVAYGTGVVGSAWQVGVGIVAGLLSFAVNLAVLGLLFVPGVRAAFRG